MAVTDITTLILSIFFLVRGASRGFMNSLTGPFSIIVTTILSIMYYQATADLITSLLIGLIGPLFLNYLLKFLIKTWAKATNTEINPGFLSRLGGSILTLIWGWVFIIFTLILLTVLPLWGESLRAVHNDVMKSSSYLIAKHLEETLGGPHIGHLVLLPDTRRSSQLPAASKQNVPAAAGEASSNNAESLAADPRFQKVLQDPEIQKEITDHDMVKLMSNPKMMALVQQIMSDPATMKKVMALYSSQTEPQATQSP
jgi:uncharacterized membrane protein required for colicin V production